MAISGECNSLGTHPHVCEERSGTRTAVIDERDWALGGVHAIFCIGDIEHGGFGRTVIGANHVSGGGCRVIDRLPADVRGVVRDGSLLFRGRPAPLPAFALLRLRRARSLTLLLWWLLG